MPDDGAVAVDEGQEYGTFVNVRVCGSIVWEWVDKTKCDKTAR